MLKVAPCNQYSIIQVTRTPVDSCRLSLMKELSGYSQLLVSRQTCLHRHPDVVSHLGVNLQLTRATQICHPFSHLMICLHRVFVPLICALGDSHDQHT
jgi:hypothetical protein